MSRSIFSKLYCVVGKADRKLGNKAKAIDLQSI